MRHVSYVCGTLSALLLASQAQAFPIATTGTGAKVVVGSTGNVVATYQGTSAAFTDLLYLVQPGSDVLLFNNQTSPVGTTFDLGTFAAGTELVFRLFVTNTENDFFTGPASRNPDGFAHANVDASFAPGETLVSFEDLLNGPFDYNDLSFSFTNTVSVSPDVPEPASWAMMLVGFGAIGGAMRSRRKVAVSFG